MATLDEVRAFRHVATESFSIVEGGDTGNPDWVPPAGFVELEGTQRQEVLDLLYYAPGPHGPASQTIEARNTVFGQ